MKRMGTTQRHCNTIRMGTWYSISVRMEIKNFKHLNLSRIHCIVMFISFISQFPYMLIFCEQAYFVLIVTEKLWGWVANERKVMGCYIVVCTVMHASCRLPTGLGQHCGNEIKLSKHITDTEGRDVEWLTF